jgi:hypothetical protein
VKLKRAAEKFDTALREQKEVKELVTTRVDNPTQPWNILSSTVELELLHRDPALVVCALRWLESDLLSMMCMSKFGLTLSWDCDARSQKRRRLREREVLGLLVSFARVTHGPAPTGANGSDGPGVRFLLAKSFCSDGYVAYDKISMPCLFAIT